MDYNLTPLEAFYDLLSPIGMTKMGIEKYCLIESSLKELDQLEIDFSKLYERTYKEHKALEIIKKHKLMNYVIKNKKCANMYHLTNEEIEILKEVL